MRKLACYAAVLGAAAVAFSIPAGAQQAPLQAKRQAPPATQLTPAARYAALRDRLNQNTVTVISGNPNGTSPRPRTLLVKSAPARSRIRAAKAG